MASIQKRPGIPIPSFSTQLSPQRKRIAADWKVDAMIKLEIALQHWFRRQRQERLSLKDYFALKLDWGSDDDKSEEKEAGNSEHQELMRKAGLTVQERILHDLLCVAADPNTTDTLYEVDTEKGTLKVVPHSVQQLKRAVAETASFDDAWSQKILAMLVAHQASKQEKLVPRSKDNTNQQSKQKSIVVSFAKPHKMATTVFTFTMPSN